MCFIFKKNDKKKKDDPIAQIICASWREDTINNLTCQKFLW